jgi:hypothetical protein
MALDLAEQGFEGTDPEVAYPSATVTFVQKQYDLIRGSGHTSRSGSREGTGVPPWPRAESRALSTGRPGEPALCGAPVVLPVIHNPVENFARIAIMGLC